MKFLLCTSFQSNEDDCEAVDVDNNHPIKSKSRIKRSPILVWSDRLRKLLTREDGSKNHVEISPPVLMSPDDTDQVTGVVKVRPIIEEQQSIDIDPNQNEEPRQPISREISQTSSAHNITIDKINAETNTDANHQTEEQSYENVIQLAAKQDNDRINWNDGDDDILNHGWYWGDISRRDAESLLKRQEEGTFLVRKSSDSRFLYSLSFRSNGKTLHTRIELCNGLYFFYSNDTTPKQETDGSSSLIELISDAMNQNNADNIFFYSRGLKNEASLHTITLVKPLSRFSYVMNYPENNTDNSVEHKSLQYLCKFVIHHSAIAREQMKSKFQALPKELKSFLQNVQLFPNT